MTPMLAIDALKALLRIGLCAFLAGFCGYLALNAGPGRPPASAVTDAVYAPMEMAGPARAV